MKDLKSILEANGIEADKVEAIEREALENYRTRAELDQKVAKLKDAERRAEEAEQALADIRKATEGEGDKVAALEKRLKDYEEAEKRRSAEAEEGKRLAAFSETFAEAVGGRKFANKLTEEAVKAKAWETCKASPDLDVSAVVAGIVGDGAGIWANPQQDPSKMPQGGTGVGGGALSNLEDMSVEEIARNMDEVDKMLNAKG